METRVKAWNDVLSERTAALLEVQSKIDERCFALYKIDANDRFPLLEVDAEVGTTPNAEHEAVVNSIDDGDLRENLNDVALSTQLISWAVEVRQLNNLMADDAEPSSSRRKEVETQETLVEELRGMLDEVTRVVPLWSPSLDDGITLTMAMLWRLVPQHRGWQKELKSRWLELESGRRTAIGPMRGANCRPMSSVAIICFRF